MIINKFQEVVFNNKDRIAYKINNQKITYQKLFNEALIYSDYLRKQGNTPVIIYGHKSISMVISIFACLFSKRAYVPIELNTPKARINKIIELTKSNLLIKNEDIEIPSITCLKLSELKQFEKNDYFESKNKYAYIIFTSGSTGIPKGVPITYKNLENFIRWISNLYPLNTYKNSNVLNQASFSFDLSVADLFYSLFNGHTLIGQDKTNEVLENINNLFSNENINICVFTPTFIKLCLLNSDFNEIKLPNLKCIYFCGELLEVKVVKELFNRFKNLKIINAYGPTEATSAVSGILITKKMLRNKMLPVGKLDTSAVSIYIKNHEIILKGKSVTTNYLNNIQGGFFKENNQFGYKTGDLGYIKNNLLYCLGRKDSQIKYKGYRIELLEIEYNLNKIKEIKDAVVIPKYDDKNIVKNIQAFVILKDGTNCLENYIKDELKKYLPLYMIPKVIKIVSEFPINQNGKLDRKELIKL